MNHQWPCLNFSPSLAQANGVLSNTTVLLRASVPIWSELPVKLTVENRRRKGLLPEVALLSKMRSSLAVGAPEPTFPFASFQYDMSVSAALPAACVPVFFAGLECHSVLPYDAAAASTKKNVARFFSLFPNTGVVM